jgi:hypothetical protein
VTPHRREVAGLGEKANVETIAGERLNERGTSAVPDRGESQIESLTRPTLAGWAALLAGCGYFGSWG